jgi:hypothetical protein
MRVHTQGSGFFASPCPRVRLQLGDGPNDVVLVDATFEGDATQVQEVGGHHASRPIAYLCSIQYVWLIHCLCSFPPHAQVSFLLPAPPSTIAKYPYVVPQLAVAMNGLDFVPVTLDNGNKSTCKLALLDPSKPRKKK